MLDTKTLEKPGELFLPPKSFLFGPHFFRQRKVPHWSRAVYAFFFPMFGPPSLAHAGVARTRPATSTTLVGSLVATLSATCHVIDMHSLCTAVLLCAAALPVSHDKGTDLRLRSPVWEFPNLVVSNWKALNGVGVDGGRSDCPLFYACFPFFYAFPPFPSHFLCFS